MLASTSQEGLCPLCYEPIHRGGRAKKEWLKTKVSAYKWCVGFLGSRSDREFLTVTFMISQSIINQFLVKSLTVVYSYHMQYFHGGYCRGTVPSIFIYSTTPHFQGSAGRPGSPSHPRLKSEPSLGIRLILRNEKKSKGENAINAPSGSTSKGSRMYPIR